MKSGSLSFDVQIIEVTTDLRSTSLSSSYFWASPTGCVILAHTPADSPAPFSCSGSLASVSQGHEDGGRAVTAVGVRAAWSGRGGPLPVALGSAVSPGI